MIPHLVLVVVGLIGVAFGVYGATYATPPINYIGYITTAANLGVVCFNAWMFMNRRDGRI